MEEKKKSPITSILFMAILLILALTGGYLLGNDDFLKLRTEEPAEVKDDEDIKKIEVKDNIPAEDLYTFEYFAGNEENKGYMSLFLVADGDLYYKSVSKNNGEMGLVRTVDYNDSEEKKELKKVDTSTIGKVRRIKALLNDNKVVTMIITENGKVYTISVNQETGIYTPITTVEALREYEVDDIKSYKLSETNEPSFEIILKNGETVKK